DPLKSRSPLAQLTYGGGKNVNFVKTKKSQQALFGLSNDYSLFNTEKSVAPGLASQISNDQHKLLPAVKEHRPSITSILKQRIPHEKN
ncbi:unnamed protein product, partial [Didymodactylos carnosus]